jgi:hypothetical protein
VPQQQTKTVGLARRERKPSRGGSLIERAIIRHVADCDRHRATAQRLLHGPQHVGRARHGKHHQTIWIETMQGETRTVRRTVFHSGEIGLKPKHGTTSQSCESNREPLRCADMNR